MDEVHFQQHGSRCRMWVPSETRDPVLHHHPSRHHIGYFGAVRLRDGRFFFRREPDKFNAVTCGQFLEALRATSGRTARRVVVITDNARYVPIVDDQAMLLMAIEPPSGNKSFYQLTELNPIER